MALLFCVTFLLPLTVSASPTSSMPEDDYFSSWSNPDDGSSRWKLSDNPFDFESGDLHDGETPPSLEETTPSLSGDLASYFEQSGANDLFDDLPPSTRELLERMGIQNLDSDAFTQLGFLDFIKLIFAQLTAVIRTPLLLLCTTLGMVLLASFIGVLRSSVKDGSQELFTVVAVLCVAGVILSPIAKMLRETVSLIEEINPFMLGFIPVYAGIVAASGKPVSAFTYNTMLVSATQLISYLLTHTMLPLMSIFLAVSVMGATNNHINVSVIAKSLRTTLLWAMGLFLTIFVALLTIRSFVATAADTVAFRAGKFVASSLIPVVGGAVSESLSVVQGSLGVIRATVGAFGILVVLLIFLGGILELFLMGLALKISAAVSDMLEIETVKKLLESAHFVISLLLAVLIFFALMLIISISLILVMGGMS